MAINTQIEQAEWQDFFVTFTNGNRGRLVRIELISDALGVQSMVDGAALVALDYDPVGKANNLVFSYGDEAAPSSHVIAGPVALWQAQDENGLVVSLEIESEDGSRKIVTFS